MERILTRVALRSARPRDLTRLHESLAVLPQIKTALTHAPVEHLATLAEAAKPLPELVELLGSAIQENPPVVIRDGGVIADGYDSELDELRALNSNAGDFLLELEEREKTRTGIATLKVGYNRVHGYYIEISRGQSDNAPVEYVRRQTLKNAERFITPELKKFEDKALSARVDPWPGKNISTMSCWRNSTKAWNRCKIALLPSPSWMFSPPWPSALRA